ncbi:39S ribosomal protein L23 [Echinococcus granulosus]|uniref:Large ribosomal subunit protein uL23m n=1 Tax=Echinococcus granulosus TaxID=6210 RepID=W6UHJ8_ECHGR|nr:39S ribosomal protein L23 [Echinococcus granulosus]EUB57562.1 39S ribosomal protein L23 [Echinococcus granulosus]
MQKQENKTTQSGFALHFVLTNTNTCSLSELSGCYVARVVQSDMRPVIYFNPIAIPKTKHYVPLWNRHVVYPKFTPGDPQLRMFLPPFWMKMLYPGEKCPKRLVVFKVHPQMTKYDVKQYLEKIYKVPVIGVQLKMLYHDLHPLDTVEDPRRAVGAAFPHLLPREPERYEKVAYVHLALGYEFEFPDIFKDGKRPSEEISRLIDQAQVREDLQPAKEDKEDAVEAEQTRQKTKEMEEKTELKPSQPSSFVINRWFQS